MKYWILLSVVFGAIFITTGCGDGVAYTRRERMHRWGEYYEDDMHEFNDDIDLLMLNDRPSRLSKWK